MSSISKPNFSAWPGGAGLEGNHRRGLGELYHSMKLGRRSQMMKEILVNGKGYVGLIAMEPAQGDGAPRGTLHPAEWSQSQG